MIPKQWFEEQGIEVKEIIEDVFYYPTTTFTLNKEDRKVEIILQEYRKTTLIAEAKLLFYKALDKLQKVLLLNNFIKIEAHKLTLTQYQTEISFYEQNCPLLSYRANYFSSTEEKIKVSLIKWLVDKLTVEDVSKYNKNIEIHVEFYQNYYMQYGAKALLIYEWDKLKEFIDRYGASNETLRTNMNVLYDLCRNSAICSKFFCSGNGYYLTLYLKEIDNLYYSLVVKENSYLLIHKHPMYDNTKNIWNYEYDEQNQEFPTPHEAVAYLETLLAEHLKNA